MSVGLAPRPANEEMRARAVVKTGLIDAPNPEIFQVYCDLAKDITGFEEAQFSLYDGEMSCGIANAGTAASSLVKRVCGTRIVFAHMCFWKLSHLSWKI